jgi:hypothetical protein
MSRVINTDNPGKRRNHLMRTGAELLRHLSQKQQIDDEAKDMLALLIFTLQEIADGIERSTLAWEKRNYWLKVEEFRNNWNWTGHLARKLEKMVLNEEWQDLPPMMVKLFPHFSDITVLKFTREPSLWQGCYVALLDHRPV